MLLRAAKGFLGSAVTSKLNPAGVAARAFTTSCSTSFSSETDDDFKPKAVEGLAKSVEAQIKEDITSNRVFLYMKGNPENPMCGFSNMACRVLDAYGAKYGSRNVLADPEIREGVKKFSEWPTIPQVFIDGEFVGGSDILMNLHQSGELETLLKEKS